MRALRNELARCSVAAAEASRATKYAIAAALDETPSELIADILAHDQHPEVRMLTARAPRWTHRDPDPEAAGRHREPAPRTSNEVAVALGCALVGRLPGEVSTVQPNATAQWRRGKRAGLTLGVYAPAPRVRPAQSVIDEYQLSVSGELLCGYGARPDAQRQPQSRQPRPQHRTDSTATAGAAPPTPLQAAPAGNFLQIDPRSDRYEIDTISDRYETRFGSVSDAEVRRLVRQASRSDVPPPRRQSLGSPPKRPPIKRPTTAPAARPVYTVNYHSNRWDGIESRALDLAGAHKIKPPASRSKRALSTEELELLQHGLPSAGLIRQGSRSTPKYGTKRDPTGGWLEPTTAWGVPLARPYVRRR